MSPFGERDRNGARDGLNGGRVGMTVLAVVATIAWIFAPVGAASSDELDPEPDVVVEPAGSESAPPDDAAPEGEATEQVPTPEPSASPEEVPPAQELPPAEEVPLDEETATLEGPTATDEEIASVADDAVLLAAVPVDQLVPFAQSVPGESAVIASLGVGALIPTLTMSQAITTAGPGEIINLTPGAYRFTNSISLPKSVRFQSTGIVQVFGRVTFAGGSLALANVVFSPSANSQTTLTSTANGATLTDVQVANLDGFTGGTGIATGASTAVTITNPTISKMALGINLAGGGGATVTNPTISGATNGITVTATASLAGPTISGGSIEALTVGIALGATQRPSVSNVSIFRADPTNNAGVIGINVLNAVGATVTGATISGYSRGINLPDAAATSGLTVTGGDISAVTHDVTLGNSTGARISGTTLRGQPRAGVVVATTGVNILNASDVVVTNITTVGIAKGVVAALANDADDISVIGGTFGLAAVTAATGVDLGGTKGAIVDGANVTGASTSRSVGITTNRSSDAEITDVTITATQTGIGATWIRLSGTPLGGVHVARATVTQAGIGIYTANTTGALVEDVTVDSTGEGVAGHEDADFTLLNSTITGHPGTLAPAGTNCVRFYYTTGMTVTNVTMTGGSTGLYLDMSFDAEISDIEISNMTWYATYAESITGYHLFDSDIHDNAGIGNLTINPSSLDAIDLRQVSSNILIEDNTFTDNLAGLLLPIGAFDIVFRRNVVSGTDTWVLRGTPVHNVEISDNRIDFTHDPGLSGAADDLESATPPPPPDVIVGGPNPDETLGEDPPPPDAGVEFATAALVDGGLETLAFEKDPPATPASAIWIEPRYFNLDTQTASSDNITIVDNVFTGDGSFIGVGTVSTTGSADPNATPDPSLQRTLRSTIEVSRNVFPQDSTAIVTADDAEQGLDANTDNTMINGDAAVDARDDNDWGSPCFARVPTDNYDGGGAYVFELRTTQVLYPQACTTGPVPAGDPGGLPVTGGDPTRLMTLAILLITTGLVALAARRRTRRSSLV